MPYNSASVFWPSNLNDVTGGGAGPSVGNGILWSGLSSLVPSGPNSIVIIDGFAAIGDGAQGVAVWNPTDTRSSDGGTILAVTGVAVGRWNRVTNGIYNVLWFGAIGDGVTDNTTAFQKALLAAAGGRLNIPEGTFYVNAVLIPNAGTRIMGDGQGTVILTQYGIQMTAVNDVSIENLKVNMLLPTVPTSGPASTTTSFQAIAIRNGCQRITIKRNYLTNFSQFGIVVGDLATNNGCNDIRIEDNIVDCTGMTTASLANDPIGIECFPKGSTSSFEVTPGLIIHNNTVLGPTTPNSILAGIKCSVQNGVRVTNNFVNNIVLNTIPEGGIDILNCDGAVIEGNVVDNCTIGISLASLASGPSLVTLTEAIAANNVVSNYGQYGILLSLGINGLVIDGNDLTSTTSTHGIWAGAWVSNVNSAVSGTGGQIELGFLAATGFTNGQNVLVAGVGGVPNATGYWVITVVDATHCILNGSTFAGGYTSGGTATTVYQDLVITNNRLNGSAVDINVFGPAPNYVIANNVLNGGLIVATDNDGLVSNNSVTNVSGTAITLSGNNCVCSGNAIQASLSAGISATGNGNTVSNNSVIGSGVNITITGNDCVATGNACNANGLGVYNITCVGNNDVVTGNSLLEANGGVGIQGTDSIVSNNSIRLSGLYGVQIISGNYHTIVGNRIIDPNTSGTAGGCGVYVGASTNAEVYGNHIENRTGSGQAFYGIIYSGSNMLMRDNRIVNMQTADVESVSPGTTYTMSQETYTDGTLSTAPADMTEDVLKTVTFDAGSLGVNGGLRMKATGSSSGAGSATKTIKLYVSTTPFTLSISSTSSITWTIEATVYNNGTESNMAYEYKTWAAGALVTQASGTASFVNEATSTVPVKVTSQKGASADTVTCNLLTVERVQ